MTARRIAIAVEPRLLADTLSVALRSQDVEVVLLLDHDAAPLPPDYDVAIVMEDDPVPVRASVIIRLPKEPQVAQGSVTTVRGTHTAVVGDLGALLRTVRPFLG